MPEIRYQTVETYDNKGKVIETESVPYEVSDEELGREQAESTIAELSALADEALAVPQIGRFLKALARLRR